MSKQMREEDLKEAEKIKKWFEETIRRTQSCNCCHYENGKVANEEGHDAYICTESRISWLLPIGDIFASKYAKARAEGEKVAVGS